jgi:hypothetical protein
VVQLVAAAASSLQVVVVAVASVTLNAVVAVVLDDEDPLAGELMLTAGLTESTVKLTEALPEPAALVAVTTTV